MSKSLNVTHHDLKDITEKVNHTDSRVSLMEGRLAGVEDNVSNVFTVVNRIENSLLNKPPVWNLATVMTAIGMVGTLLFSTWVMTTNQRDASIDYVDLRLTELKAVGERDQKYTEQFILNLKDWQTAADGFQEKVHTFMGEQEVESKYLDRRTLVLERKLGVE